MNKNNAESDNTDVDFTNEPQNVIIENNQSAFMESSMLALMLFVAAAIIFCDNFNAVTSIVYIMPCTVSTVARMSRLNLKEPSFKIHLIGFIVAAIIIIVMIMCNAYGYKEKWVNFILFAYPIYESINTVVQKLTTDL